MTFRTIAVTLLTTILLTACSGGSEDTGELIRSETQNIKELVQDYSLGNIQNDSASITAQELIVTKSDGSKHVYDISTEDFFVSIAPYVNETHT